MGSGYTLPSFNLSDADMTTLRTFITERRAQIRAEIAALRIEGRELKVALDAIDADSSEAPAYGSRRTAGRMTIKDRIVEALKECPEGGSVEKIIAWISKRHGLDIPRSSLSPQISRLKREGIVVFNESKNWQLAEFLRADQEAAGGEKCSSSTPPTIFERRPIGAAQPPAQGREAVSG